VVKTLPQTTRPSLLHLCSCGHGASQHPNKGQRSCGVLACQCERYDRAPQPGCATCNHPPPLHSPRSSQDPWACTAPGCGCRQWQPPRWNEGNSEQDHGDHDCDRDRCIVVLEAGRVRVTISIPSEAKRHVLISQSDTAMFEIELSRPPLTRRASTTRAANRSG